MTTAQEQKLSSRPATVDDMIGWLTEQAFHSGQTGFTAICDPRDINTLAFVRPSSHLPCLATPLSAEVDISTALGHAIGDWHRDQYLTNVVRANKTMLRETEEAVHGRLRRAGMQAQEFEMIKQQKLGLRGKIARLHELETQHLRPRSGDIFVIWLIKEEDALKEKVKVILPKKGSYTHFLAVLRDVWLAKVDPDVQLEQSLGFGAGAWTYQLINKQLQVVAAAPRVKLLDEIGYREMIKQITRKGSVTPSAVFWHESTLQSMGSGPGKDDTVEDDKVEDVEGVEEIDENGLPYFQPVDWKMLLQKRAAGTDLVAGPSDAGAME